MTYLLEGRNTAVTGAGSGIGRTIALGFAQQKAHVIVMDIDDTAVEGTVSEIKAEGGKAFGVVFDITDLDACDTAAQQIADELGPISVLVNNAGINRRTPFVGEKATVRKDWKDIINVNVMGNFNVIHAFLDQLSSQNGQIINIGSIQSFVHVAWPNSAAYTTSKHALLGMTRALAAELGPRGIRVNAIAPGLIETPINEAVRIANPDIIKTYLAHTPLGRSGKPEDMVGPALFLASDMSAYVSGCALTVDGGYCSL